MQEHNELVQEPVKKRRGRVRYAAPLGFLVLLFALIGVISVIVGGIGLIQKWTDDTPLREEMYTFLDPVMQFFPSDFEDAGEDGQDSLLLAAVYRVSEAERIRQLREKDDTCAYELDETQWRMKIPETVISDSFAHLFGDAALTHRTVGEVEYKADEKLYYVPLSINTSGYTPVIGSIKRSGEQYTVEVTYVANTDIEVNDKGESVPPTFDMGKYTQRYTVRRGEDKSLTLLSVAAVG